MEHGTNHDGQLMTMDGYHAFQIITLNVPSQDVKLQNNQYMWTCSDIPMRCTTEKLYA